jgi:two-component system response regulator (stage 0 sporulation protein A)
MHQNSELKVIGSASDGLRALALIQSSKPDIILLDPLLPGIDGITLIKTLNRLKSKPIIICMSRFYTTTSIEIARENGASYYMYKPIAPNALTEIVIECANLVSNERTSNIESNNSNGNSELLNNIHAILRDLGFSQKHIGSKYIENSVKIAHESLFSLHNLSSGIYQKVAEDANVSIDSIERNIRTAISHANHDGLLGKKMGQRPTNKNCIRYILRQLDSGK